MKNIKISLRIWLILENILEVILILFYWLNTRGDIKPMLITVGFTVIIFIFVIMFYFEKKKDIIDEFALEALNRANVNALQVARFCILVGMLYAVVTNDGKRMMDDIPVFSIYLTVSFIVIGLIRTATFCIIDMKGMRINNVKDKY